MVQTIFALVVAVNQYQSDTIANLQGCVRDAARFSEIIRQYSPNAEIRLLTDASATRAEILRAFREHLMDNPRLTRNDPVVVYFTGKGRRVTAPDDSPGRDVDILIPQDYSEGIAGISDSTIDGLLCDLAKKVGTNIVRHPLLDHVPSQTNYRMKTLILDTSFSFYIPRGKMRHRSETSPSHMSSTSLSDSASYPGFFGHAGPSYVVLVACQQHQLAYESSDGGIFTTGLVSLLRQKRLMTYRELATALKFEGQDSLCAGLHSDRLLFSMPPDTRVPKLRVFLGSPTIDLGIEPDADFVRVEDKEDANVALIPAPEGGILIERLDGLVAMYASRHVTVHMDVPITSALNKIARFNYYLGLEPSRNRDSFTWKTSPGLAVDTIRPSMKLYSFKYRAGDMTGHGTTTRNLFRNGVARLDSVSADRGYALQIASHSRQSLYPYLLAFDPSNYTVQASCSSFCSIYPPPTDMARAMKPLKGHRMCFIGSSFTVGDGKAGGAPLTFATDSVNENEDAVFFKLVLCSKPIDIRHMMQDSALTTSPSRPESSDSEPHRVDVQTIATIPGCWDTVLATVSLQTRTTHSKLSWKKIVSILNIERIIRRRDRFGY
ncbi:caspase domain-containing protein [Mycena maculata]|uniref:Caspase domain-containing protein n=1 Tax=Mycena maculata TaxID=230809 RepID=A0AAD7I708_9AGAR|nr:caspase domain-containing protein [Mycena maculata]